MCVNFAKLNGMFSDAAFLMYAIKDGLICERLCKKWQIIGVDKHIL
jgi:hypothetical protein